MATSQNPLTGKMSGAMGNFVTSTLGSKNIVRAKAFNVRDAKTDEQLKQRDGLKLVAGLYTALGGIPEEGYLQRAENTSVYTAFVARNLSEVLDKNGDSTVLDYSKVSLSDGTFRGPMVRKAVLSEKGVEIVYAPQLALQTNKSDDQLIAVLLLKNDELWVSRQARGDAEEATLTIEIANLETADVLAMYVFAVRADKSKSSRTTWVAL